jgi:hypothetical protein
MTNFLDNKQFTVRVDSDKTVLLDTLITIPTNNKKPFISFQDLEENGFKRVVFIIDENDERIIIP